MHALMNKSTIAATCSPNFTAALAAYGLSFRRAAPPTTLQVNLGRRCNMTCRHCHVDAGPQRTETMPPEVVARVLLLVERSPSILTVDLTGGAPELHPQFRALVETSRALGREVIDRSNLTIFFEPGMADLPVFLAAQTVHIIASLPCYLPANLERQRGVGAFTKSIEALRLLNDLGYGQPGSSLRLDLVFNPLGPFLPPAQGPLEDLYREELGRRFGLSFHRLLTLTNMPIRRFARSLGDGADAYLRLLVEHFNPETVPGLMCQSLVSVGWTGALADCDFHQMAGLPLGGTPRSVFEIERLDDLTGPIASAPHCFGCTAGAGSSCSGALVTAEVAAKGARTPSGTRVVHEVRSDP